MSWVITGKERDRKEFKWISSYIWAETGSPYDDEGYDYFGYNEEGYNRDGWDKEGYNEAGFNKKGIHKVTKRRFDPEGFDCDGYDEEGYDRKGYNEAGFNKKGKHKITKTYFDPDGFNSEGVDSRGFDRDLINKFTKGKYDLEGFDFKGYNKFGFNKEGLNKKGESIIELRSKCMKELEDIVKAINTQKKKLSSNESNLKQIYQNAKIAIISEIDNYQQTINNNQYRINELNNQKSIITERIEMEKKKKFNPFKLKKQKIQSIKPSNDDEIAKIDEEITLNQNKIKEYKDLINKLNEKLNLPIEKFNPSTLTDGNKYKVEFEEIKRNMRLINVELDLLNEERSKIQERFDEYEAAFKSLSKYL